MKIITQNSQALINAEQVFRIAIEGETNKSKIIAVTLMGETKILGFYSHSEVQHVFDELVSSQCDVYKMPRSEIHSGGRTLTQSELSSIEKSIKVSRHAVSRMVERGLFDKIPPKEEFSRKMSEFILKPYLAFWNSDGTAIIALDEYRYFVIKYQYAPYNAYVIMTYCSESINNVSVSEKKRYAQAQYKNCYESEEKNVSAN